MFYKNIYLMHIYYYLYDNIVIKIKLDVSFSNCFHITFSYNVPTNKFSKIFLKIFAI